LPKLTGFPNPDIAITTGLAWERGILLRRFSFFFQEVDEGTVLERPNIYCHFAQGIGEPKYMPITDWSVLSNLLQEALSSYNDLVAAMNLVLFEDAMMHICRCATIPQRFFKIEFE